MLSQYMRFDGFESAEDFEKFTEALENIVDDYEDVAQVDEDDLCIEFEDPGCFRVEDEPRLFQKLAKASGVPFTAVSSWTDMSNDTSIEFKAEYRNRNLIVQSSGWDRECFAGDMDYDKLMDVFGELGWKKPDNLSEEEYAKLRDQDVGIIMSSIFGVTEERQYEVILDVMI